MHIDKALISRLEKLARLQLSEEERTRLSADLEKILEMVDRLQTLDTTGVEPLVYLNEHPNVFREDTVGRQLDPAEVLKNAPRHDDRFFRAPKVIE